MEENGPGEAEPEPGAGQVRSTRTSLEAHKSVEGVVFASSLILDLSDSGLHHLWEVFKIPTLKQLYLQRNALCSIPDDLFHWLPNLTWLDLRHNRIQALPSGIGCHRYLKTLLLERNPIKRLPVELGNVTTLTALNLRCCPLEFPPQLIVQKGPAAILAFLQACASERPCPRDLASQGAKGPRLKKTVDSFPPVEKLDLSDLRSSTGSSEDWPSEEEIRRFWKLRQEIVETEPAESLAHRLLPERLPPNLSMALRAQDKEHPGPRHMAGTTQKPSRKPPPFGHSLPGLASVGPMVTGARRLEQDWVSALRKLGEQRALIERWRRDRRVLQAWRQRAQTLSRRAEQLSRVLPPRRTLVASTIPYTTDLIANEKAPTNPSGNPRQSEEKSPQAASKELSTVQGALEEKLTQRVGKCMNEENGFKGWHPSRK